MQLVTLKITDRYQTSIFDVRYQTQIRYALNFYLRDYLGIFPNDKGKFPNNPVKKVEGVPIRNRTQISTYIIYKQISPDLHLG